MLITAGAGSKSDLDVRGSRRCCIWRQSRVHEHCRKTFLRDLFFSGGSTPGTAWPVLSLEAEQIFSEATCAICQEVMHRATSVSALDCLGHPWTQADQSVDLNLLFPWLRFNHACTVTPASLGSVHAVRRFEFQGHLS